MNTNKRIVLATLIKTLVIILLVAVGPKNSYAQKRIGLDNLKVVSKKDILFYPNPESDKLTINYLGRIRSARVYQMKGLRPQTTELETKNNTIDLSQLSTGSYFVELALGGHSHTLHVVIKR